jgi:hypothetical protein
MTENSLRCTMKRIKFYRVLLFAVCSLLLAVMLVSVVLAEPGGPVKEAGDTLLGGGYTLLPVTQSQGILARGGAYTLLQPASSTLASGGCCCTYLPCLLK